jgi:Ca2+-binding RTX toxin-like protein
VRRVTSGSRRLGRRTPFALVACAFLVAPALAAAGTASVSGTTLAYQAAAGENNDVTIQMSPGRTTWTVTETSAPLTIGPGCNPGGNAQTASCPVPAPLGSNAVVGHLEDGADGASLAEGCHILDDDEHWGWCDTTVNGGDGDDTLHGNDDCDAGGALRGGAGDDVLLSGNDLQGGVGADELRGGACEGQLDGGAGADTLVGTGSYDQAVYADRETSVYVSFDGTRNDGEVGEGDLLLDIENVVTGSGDDVIVGDLGRNHIEAGAGNDVVRGGGGDDTVYGERSITCGPDDAGLGGNDELYGEEGNDQLGGCGGADLVRGGPGADFVGGSGGSDDLSGEEGDDYVAGGLGADSIAGGGGRDMVVYLRANGVFVSLDGLRNDGEQGEGDLVLLDVEDILGGSGDDVLVGDSGENAITARSGNDVVRAGGGNDTVYGDWSGGSCGVEEPRLEGDDELYGEAGDDQLFGCNGNDLLRGGAGNDSLGGGRGADGLYGGYGRDNARGGFGGDRLFGGPGPDFVHGEGGRDRIAGGRERDDLRGGAQNDTFYARDGYRDSIRGGRGWDRARIDRGLDRTWSIAAFF